MIKAAFCFTVVLIMIPQLVFAKSAVNERYITQETIDTSILRGFVLLNASADVAGVGFNHQRSLTEAKQIAQTLKARAKGDPNERYVLWKVGELEAQIYLEERDLVLQQMQKRQLTINELVDKYNAEVGKWRPDFGTLYRIHKSMDQVDPGKAGELADSYNKRKNGISREAVYFLEKALMAGNVDSARKELGYCLRNQLYLNVSNNTYKQLEDRVEGLYKALETKPLISKAAKSANALLDHIDIVEARKTLDSAGNQLTVIKKFLPQSDEVTLSAALRRVSQRLGTIEDSLVNVNIAILRSKGVDAADKYLQSVLRPYGVSREKTATVDRMILSVQSPDDGGTRPELADLQVDEEEPDASPALDEVMAKARQKAQVKMDSLRVIEEARLAKERKEQARLDSIEQAARAVEEAALQKVLRRVDSLSMVIYNNIEKGDTKGADVVLKKERSFLEVNMRPDDFALLKSTVEQFTATTFTPQTSVQIAYVNQPPENKAAAPAPVAAVPVPPDVDPRESANRERAQEEILGIYTLLEQNEIGRAYKRFLTNKTPLKKYLTSDVYSMLEMTVMQAFDYYVSQK